MAPYTGKFIDDSPVYGGSQLTNHLPMALYVLKEMGASEERILEFAVHYRNRHQISSGDPISDSIPEQLQPGSHKQYYNYRNYFKKRIDQQGVDSIITEALYNLLPGISGGAFHGIIRLAYAVDSGDVGEIINALAYWSDTFQPIKVNPMGVTEDIHSLFNHLLAHQYFRNNPPQGENIFEKMKIVTDHEIFRESAFHLIYSPENERQVAQKIGVFYLQSKHFTLLHGITAFDALMRLKPWIEQYETAFNHYILALQGAYFSTGAIMFQNHDQNNLLIPWETIFQRVIQSDDVHHLKLVASCFHLKGYDPVFQEIASGVVRDMVV